LGGAGRRDKNSNNSDNDSGAVTSLILCPTRELAYQIGGVVEELIEAMTTNSKSNRDSLNVAVITGGVPMEPQIDLLASKKLSNEKVDILIATPGRLADVLQRSNKEEDTSEKELEKKLLAALDGISSKDASLTLAQLNDLKINESIANGDDGGRSALFDMLSSVKYLVLDEADRLLSPGFKTEMDGILDLLPRPPSSKRKRKDDNDIYGESSNDSDAAKVSDSQMKTLLFSATFPEQIEPRVEKVLRRLSGYNAPPPVRLSCALAGQTDKNDHEASMRQRKRMERTTQPQAIWEGPASTIDLRAIRLDERDRTPALRRLISDYGEEWDRVLVFVATRYASEHVAMKLRKYHIRAAEIHGKLDQDARSRRLEDFRKGKTRVLIATDLASRGLDVVGLPAVVNYDLPRSTADFTHRIGRTGRAGNKGIAVSFITPANENQYNLIEKRHLKSNMVVEREILKGFEPNEAKWKVTSGAATVKVEGVAHSQAGLAHDKMFGGIKGRRKSKKDKAREKAARKEAARNN
jgi:superfamily II DNA/RNA helicase